MKKRSPREAGLIVRARREALGLIQEGIEGVSSALVGSIENGTASPAGKGPARANLMRALDWPADAYQRILDGEDPAGFDAAEPSERSPIDEAASTREDLAGLRAEVAEVKAMLSRLLELRDDRQPP